MFEFAFWACACVGMTNIIVESEISKKFKGLIEPYAPNWFMKMANCYQCSGFWSGIFITAVYSWFVGTLEKSVFQVFMGGCASSFLSVFAAYLLTYMEANSIVKEAPNE